jgi:hypothetical protein
MPKSLLETFESLPLSTKHALDDLSGARLLGLAALEIAENEAGVDRLSAEHIVACLEIAGVAVKKLSISRSLSAAKGLVSYRVDDGEVFYKIMTKGKKKIVPYLSSGQLSAVLVEKDQPRTARSELKERLGGLKGDVRICDPYYGISTLDSLDHVPKVCPMKFLSVNASGDPRSLAGAVRDFKKQRTGSEFRLAPKNAGIHDRYIVSRDKIIILGHGLKDIGNKQSFVIELGRDVASDLIDTTIKAFDSHWNKGTVI